MKKQTKEESINFLQERLDIIELDYKHELDDYKNALKVAIRSLEQNDEWHPIEIGKDGEIIGNLPEEEREKIKRKMEDTK